MRSAGQTTELMFVVVGFLAGALTACNSVVDTDRVCEEHYACGDGQGYDFTFHEDCPNAMRGYYERLDGEDAEAFEDAFDACSELSGCAFRDCLSREYASRRSDP